MCHPWTGHMGSHRNPMELYSPRMQRAKVTYSGTVHKLGGPPSLAIHPPKVTKASNTNSDFLKKIKDNPERFTNSEAPSVGTPPKSRKTFKSELGFFEKIQYNPERCVNLGGRALGQPPQSNNLQILPRVFQEIS